MNVKGLNTFKEFLDCSDLTSEQYKNATNYITKMGYDLNDDCVTDPIFRYCAYCSHYKVMLLMERRMSGINYA